MWRVRVLLEDLVFAARSLRRAPGLTVLAVVTLGLGVGANTAVFTIINGSLIHVLPWKNAERLVTIQDMRPPEGGGRRPVTVARCRDIAAQARSFSAHRGRICWGR